MPHGAAPDAVGRGMVQVLQVGSEAVDESDAWDRAGQTISRRELRALRERMSQDVPADDAPAHVGPAHEGPAPEGPARSALDADLEDTVAHVTWVTAPAEAPAQAAPPPASWSLDPALVSRVSSVQQGAPEVEDLGAAVPPASPAVPSVDEPMAPPASLPADPWQQAVDWSLHHELPRELPPEPEIDDIRWDGPPPSLTPPAP
ncbi:MAG TPA: hypothetical protein VN257_10065, partial [Actinotalea sp.]|nr:hypothetical protein [Actinotalea sp.]